MSDITIRAPLDGLEDEEARRFLPPYLVEPSVFPMSWIKRGFINFAQKLIQAGIWTILRPRREVVGDLNKEEVVRVYNREAATYDWKHHLTTRCQDTMWRRAAAEISLEYIRRRRSATAKILDLCTGTGLTIVEMGKVFSTHLQHRDVELQVVGLDYNEKMLDIARQRLEGNLEFFLDEEVRFVQGDATALTFEANSFDVVTQMFGIGGIKEPVKVFENVLRVLKPQGQYFLIDMHRPIRELPGEYPLVGPLPVLEAQTYEKTTIPLALHRLWGWRDTTLDFYLLPLITQWDSDGKCWGFETVTRHYEPERWWFALPVMPTMRTLVEKTEITKQEGHTRQRILTTILRHSTR